VGLRLVGGGLSRREPRRGLVDTAPLRRFLCDSLKVSPDEPIHGIQQNIDSGALRAVALTATSYTTGQSVTWLQGRDVELWQRPQRRSHTARLTVDHIMASSAIPLLFPSVRVRDEWYGDGGVRLTAPLSPALHLGATRVLAISTRYAGTMEEASVRSIDGYPSPAQILGILFNAVFLDSVDEDIRRLNTVNQLVQKVPPEARGNLREVHNLVIRPSRDLGRIARKFEPRLPGFFRYLTRGLGTQSSRSADMLSLILFQEDYLRYIIQLGEEDAERDAARVEAFFSELPSVNASATAGLP
jgi:NTE family protein